MTACLPASSLSVSSIPMHALLSRCTLSRVFAKSEIAQGDDVPLQLERRGGFSFILFSLVLCFSCLFLFPFAHFPSRASDVSSLRFLPVIRAGLHIVTRAYSRLFLSVLFFRLFYSRINIIFHERFYEFIALHFVRLASGTRFREAKRVAGKLGEGKGGCGEHARANSETRRPGSGRYRGMESGYEQS